MSGWLEALRSAGARAQPAVLVTVAGARGSAPREAGAKMLVTAHAIAGTVGGGRLEHEASAIAREAIERMAGGAGPGPVELRRFPLGAALGQCCGGTATLLFEPVAGGCVPGWAEAVAASLAERRRCAVATRVGAPAGTGKRVLGGGGAWGSLGEAGLDAAVDAAAADLIGAGPGAARRRFEHGGETIEVVIEVLAPDDLEVWLFGAGHVGTAVATVLSVVPCRAVWIDSRPGMLPASPPANFETRAVEHPEDEVAEAPSGAAFLVMTHRHALDETICERVLARDDFLYCGLIGSATKRRRFERRLRLAGVEPARLERLTCPIGIEGIPGKHPGTIAVAAVAQILRVHAGAVPARGTPGPPAGVRA